MAFVWYRRRKARRDDIGHTPYVNPKPEPVEAKEDKHVAPISPISAAAASPVPEPRVQAAPREKVRLPFTNQNEGPGSYLRNGWRSSLFELPGNRVIRAQSRIPPPGTAVSEGDVVTSTAASSTGDPAIHPAIRFTSPPPHPRDTDTHPQLTGSRVEQHDRVSAAVPRNPFPLVPGPESHITESTEPPDSVPDAIPPLPEATAPSPSSSPRPENVRDREKATFQGPHSGTSSSLPLSASTVPPPSSSSPSSASEIPNHILLRELAGLRDQVRHLTELHRGDGGAYSAEEVDPHEPPPEYVGRDSDEESGI